MSTLAPSSARLETWKRLVHAELAVRDCTEKGHRVPASVVTIRNVLRDLYADVYYRSDVNYVIEKLRIRLGEERAVPIKYASGGELSWVEGRDIEIGRIP